MSLWLPTLEPISVFTILFYPLIEFGANTLFCVGAPMNAHIHVVKHRETTFAALHFDV